MNTEREALEQESRIEFERFYRDLYPRILSETEFQLAIDVWKASRAALSHTQEQTEPVAYLRYRNNEIDWSEDCLHPDKGGTIESFDEGADEYGDIYTEKPLYLHPPKQAVELKEPCEYTECNSENLWNFEVSELAKESGFEEHRIFGGIIVRHSNGGWVDIQEKLVAFAKLIVGLSKRNRLDKQAVEVPEGWISVKDRLPERQVSVLVSDGNNVGYCYLTRHGDWNVCASNDYVPYDQITHWMPLPASPTNTKG